MAQKTSVQVLRQLLPMTVVSLAASLTLAGIVLHLERTNAIERFQELADQRIIAIRSNIAIALDSVDLLAGHFTVTPPGSTSRQGFALMVSRTLANHRFVQGFSWDPKVLPDDVAALEAAAHADGLDGFRVTERDADGKPVPVARRDFYIPITYMEPQAVNAKALGFDLASHPVRRLALETARDQGSPQATGRITLVQESGNQYGVLVLAPVFTQVGPRTTDENRQALSGYVSGVFRLGDLVERSGEGSLDQAIPLVDIHLFDLSAPSAEQRLYPKDAANGADMEAGPYTVTDRFEMAGRQWQLLAVPSAAYLSANQPVASIAVLAVALLATAFYLSYLRGRIHQAETARAQAAMISRIAESDRFEALGTLAGGIAHEINTPTQYVGDNLRFLKEGTEPLLDLARQARQEAQAPDPDWSKVAQTAQALELDFLSDELPAAADQALDGTARIAKIVQAIKEFSYPSSKTPQPFDLNHMIDVVATVTRNQWKYVAEMEMTLDPDLPKISAIEGEINQVLVNLFVNAAHAIAAKGAAQGRIEVTTRALGDQIEFSVSDTGIGIPQENLKQVFEMFFTTKEPGKGTGQGLAISRAIIHRHGGQISVDSQPGEGARFTIRLPLAAPESACRPAQPKEA